MSRNYKFHNPEGLYFVSFAVVGWLDVFTRNEYKDLIVESFRSFRLHTKPGIRKIVNRIQS